MEQVRVKFELNEIVLLIELDYNTPIQTQNTVVDYE